MSTPSTKRRARADRAAASSAMLPQPRRIDREDRQDRAELDQHLEGLAGTAKPRKCPASRRWPVEETGRNSVSALDDAEQDDLPDRHGRHPSRRHGIPRKRRRAAGSPNSPSPGRVLHPRDIGTHPDCTAIGSLGLTSRASEPEVQPHAGSRTLRSARLALHPPGLAEYGDRGRARRGAAVGVATRVPRAQPGGRASRCCSRRRGPDARRRLR